MIVDDPSGRTTSKMTDHTIGFSVRSTSSRCRVAKIFFDLRNIREYDFAGNRQMNAIIDATQIAELRKKVSSYTQNTSQPAGEEENDNTYEEAQQAIHSLAAHATTNSAIPETTPSPRSQEIEASEQRDPDQIPSTPTPQQPSPTTTTTMTPTPDTAPQSNVDGLQLIMSTARNQAQEERRACTNPAPFTRPKGLVPRILYGARGHKLVKLLHESISRRGNEALRTWLNAPQAFQQKRREDRDPPPTSEERNHRLSLRKFNFGDVGASFRLLKGAVQPKILPTEHEIAALFPLADDNEQLPGVDNARPIVLAPDHIANIITHTPRNRASGPSQLSYDHIRYAINHDEDLLRALTDTLEFIANNPSSVDPACFKADAFFIRKPNGKPRPIVLQEAITKILNKALNAQLLAQITQGDDFQVQHCIGNRNGTTSATLKVQQFINQQGTKYAIAIDFSNAFNTINRRPIVDEMHRLHVKKGIIRYITTYLNRFTLDYEGRTIRTRRGVPQGCPLSMTLFALGTAALLRRAKEKGATTIAYADDIVIMDDDQTRLIETLIDLKNQAAQIGLEINEAKTAYYTTAKENEGLFHSLHKETWNYLGIPISVNPQLVQEEVETFLKSVKRDARCAWNAPLLHQAYFCHRMCVQTRAIHILRGTELQNTSFLREWQKKIDKLFPDAIRAVPAAYRIQPVTEGGLGLTDLQVLQSATRQGLLIDENAPEASKKIREEVTKSNLISKGSQAMITALQNRQALDEHNETADYLQDRRTIGLNAPHRTDSSWLASPPINPAQVLTDTAFRIAILQRYGIDGVAQMHETCPCCNGTPLTLAHALNCKPANSGAHIHRHNTIVRILGTHLATQGIVARYEQKPAFRAKKAPHIPDITYVTDSIPHHIDVTVYAAYGVHKDMNATGLANKRRQYTRTWDMKYHDVKFIAFDNAARPAAGTYKILQNMKISNALYKTIQLIILQANARCYENVMLRLAEQKNSVHTRHQTYMMVPPHLLEDIVKEKN